MCGIFGCISLKEKKKFNYTLFATLGIHNDSRGGDSCGIFIDGKSEYGVDKEKYFSDFFLGSKLLEETEEYNIALGHCRKASPGMAVSRDKAQPIVLRNAKTGDPLFVLIHNGTIYNYKELAEKYIPKVEITDDMTDTQVMARIFYYSGYECLSEYIGGSVFVIVDYRQPSPRVLMFKGASKKYKSSTTITEERPLFISQGEDDLVFSSLDDFLPAFRPSIEVETITENHLIEYKEDKLQIVKKYDRSNSTQEKPVKVFSTSYNRSDYGTGWGGIYTGGRSYSRASIHFEEKSNLYTADGTLLHGSRHVDKYGWCENYPTISSKEIWFFRGVVLKGKDCFRLLEEYQKKTKQSIKDFFEKNQNLIRLLSVDGLYFKNGSLVMSTNIYNYQLYTGRLKDLFGHYVYFYDSGKFIKKEYEYNSDSDKFKFLVPSDRKIIDITKLKKKLC